MMVYAVEVACFADFLKIAAPCEGYGTASRKNGKACIGEHGSVVRGAAECKKDEHRPCEENKQKKNADKNPDEGMHKPG